MESPVGPCQTNRNRKKEKEGRRRIECRRRENLIGSVLAQPNQEEERKSFKLKINEKIYKWDSLVFNFKYGIYFVSFSLFCKFKLLLIRIIFYQRFFCIVQTEILQEKEKTIRHTAGAETKNFQNKIKLYKLVN